jgi:hypothetical protein
MIDCISPDMVETAMNEVRNIPQDDVGYLTDQMLAEQPVILEYLYRLTDLPFVFEEDAEFNEAERNYILYIGLVVWKAIRESPRPMRPVTRQELHEVIDQHECDAWELARYPERLRDRVLLLIENHPEPEILRFIVDAMRPRDDDPHFPPIRLAHHLGVRMLFQIIATALLNTAELAPSVTT